jgi:hypothetical protein
LRNISKEDILSFTGEQLLVYAIKKGMVGKSSVMNISIGDVEIDSAFAKGQLVSSGRKAPFFFHFYRENGIWKIDLTSLFPVSGMAFKQMVEDSGQEENEYLLFLLETISNQEPSPNIWKPILEK